MDIGKRKGCNDAWYVFVNHDIIFRKRIEEKRGEEKVIDLT